MEKKTKKKRGRKPKNSKITNENVPVVKKKRGRKPKGGKIINKLPCKQTKIKDEKPNIILHLRCKNKDLASIQKKFLRIKNIIQKYGMSNHLIQIKNNQKLF